MAAGRRRSRTKLIRLNSSRSRFGWHVSPSSFGSVENWIEDPLSEELLKGSFEGKSKITVKVIEVGDTKRLDFEGSTEEPEMAAVGSGEEASSDEGSSEE